MSITQTVDIPASRRLVIDVPREVPLGKTILVFKPVTEAEAAPEPKSASATPHTDALLGILEGMGPIDPDDLRMERILSKHAKHLL